MRVECGRSDNLYRDERAWEWRFRARGRSAFRGIVALAGLRDVTGATVGDVNLTPTPSFPVMGTI